MSHDIADTLHRVADDATPPPFDEVAFQAHVRRERRRRTTGRVGVAVAAVAAVAAIVGPLVAVGTPDPSEPGPAGGSTAVNEVLPQQPVFFTQDMKLFVLDPQGRTHDLRTVAEGVLGSTVESGLAIGEESRLVQVDADTGGEGDQGSWTFTRGEAPLPFAVSNAARSDDGRWLAVTDLAGDVVRLDLKAGERSTVEAGGDVLDTTAAGTLTTRDGDLRVLAGSDTETVPVRADDDVFAASLGGRRVAVPARDGGTTRIVGLGGDTVATVRGVATLSDDGSQLVSVRTARDDRTSVWLGTSSAQRRLAGLPATIAEVRWLDEDTVIATDLRTLWSCETSTRVCGRLPVAPGDGYGLRIGR